MQRDLAQSLLMHIAAAPSVRAGIGVLMEQQLLAKNSLMLLRAQPVAVEMNSLLSEGSSQPVKQLVHLMLGVCGARTKVSGELGL